MVKYAGKFWPALSLACSVTNTVNLSGGGTASISFDCTTLPDPASTTALGSFTFFDVSVPVYCQPLSPGDGSHPETRSFSGALTVADEWP